MSAAKRIEKIDIDGIFQSFLPESYFHSFSWTRLLASNPNSPIYDNSASASDEGSIPIRNIVSGNIKTNYTADRYFPSFSFLRILTVCFVLPFIICCSVEVKKNRLAASQSSLKASHSSGSAGGAGKPQQSMSQGHLQYKVDPFSDEFAPTTDDDDGLLGGRVRQDIYKSGRFERGIDDDFGGGDDDDDSRLDEDAMGASVPKHQGLWGPKKK